MKYLQLLNKIKRNNLLRGALVVAATVTLSSCLKNKNTEYVEPDYGGIAAYNTYISQPKVDFIANQQRYYSGLGYGSNTSYNVFSFSGSGKLSIAFYKENMTAITDTIRTAVVTLKKDSTYSAFLHGEPTQPEILVVNDKLESPSAGKANVRFIHLVSDLGELDLICKGTEEQAQDSTLFSGVDFKGYTKFNEIPAKSYTLKVKDGAGYEEETGNAMTFSAGKNYTIYVTGRKDATSNDLKPSIKRSTN